jgi:enoyl-CoA hydratase/carnithine racemase
MTEPLVSFEICDGVAHVTVSHPMADTLDLPTVRELRRALERVEDEGATSVLLGGVGPGFTRVETTPLLDQEAATYVADLVALFARYS